MTYPKTLLHAAFVTAVGLLPAACAKPANPSGMQGMSGMQDTSNMPGHSMAGHDMAGHDMKGMDMQAMMAHCADMRRQMAQGAHPNMPDMAKMTARCDEMDRSMGSMPGMGASAPADAPPATRAR